MTCGPDVAFAYWNSFSLTNPCVGPLYKLEIKWVSFALPMQSSLRSLEPNPGFSLPSDVQHPFQSQQWSLTLIRAYICNLLATHNHSQNIWIQQESIRSSWGLPLHLSMRPLPCTMLLLLKSSANAKERSRFMLNFTPTFLRRWNLLLNLECTVSTLPTHIHPSPAVAFVCSCFIATNVCCQIHV